MSNQIRLRFAPSPTGFLHIGSLRTVLFTYIIAKKLNGKLILRIEDTDQKREVEGAIDGLINILNWVGIKFDEGPHLKGDFGPYIQTQRLEIYNKYCQELLEKNGAYYCFCDEEKLKLMREEQTGKKLPPRYDRTCRNLSEKEIKIKINNGESFVIRQKMPLDGKTVVRDELRGKIEFNNVDLDDQVLIKSNGIPTYQFANVVDDHLMEITRVTRAEEWLSSFPKNILLYQLFGWEAPKFIHFPIVLNKEGGKLSKRQGDVAVEDFKEKGYLPEALINFCALMGWHPKDDNEILNLNQIINAFKIKDMGISSAVFDIEKLDWMNGQYIRNKPLNELTKMCMPYLEKAGLIEKIKSQKSKVKITNQKSKENKITNYKILATNEIVNFDYIKKIVGLEQGRMKKLNEIGELTKFFFIDKIEYKPELLKWKKIDFKTILENLELAKKELEKIPDKEFTPLNSAKGNLTGFVKENLEKVLMNLTKKTGVGELLWPLRVALTGQKNSPGPFEVAEILRKKKCLERIGQAIKKCKM